MSEVGTKVPLEEIIKGIAIVSGNDACVAVAEHISGSAEVFVKLMNDTAQKLGMTNSHFDNTHGLPSPQQYTTAYDMAILARSYINDFPDALKIHSTLEYTYSGIRQDNRNTLLRKDPSVDGLKTGFIAESGYHLLATAKRDERRLIAVVMGAKNSGDTGRRSPQAVELRISQFCLCVLVHQRAGPVRPAGLEGAE